jgi:hypothetical protein
MHVCCFPQKGNGSRPALFSGEVLPVGRGFRSPRLLHEVLIEVKFSVGIWRVGEVVGGAVALVAVQMDDLAALGLAEECAGH